MKISKLILAFSLAILIPSGCSNEADFAGGAKTPAEEPEAADAAPEPPIAAAAPPKCDLSADFVKIDFPGNIQECVNEGNVFDFYTSGCSPVKKSSSFECTFDGLKVGMSALNLDVSPIDSAIAANAKLIACGEKRQGKTIVTQWWYPTSVALDSNDCSFSSEMVITTGCFQQDNGDGTVTEATTPEETSAIIRKCLE